MKDQTTALATRNMGELAKVGERGVVLETMGDMVAFAEKVAKSSLAPKGMDTTEKCLVAIQAGMEAGLSPMRALQSLVVINGSVTWKGDAALNLVRASGQLEYFKSRMGGKDDAFGCTISTRRVGDPELRETTFTIRDATRAGLWGKSGPWSTYPQRMLYYRALGFHLRDHYGDILMGMTTAEEAQDMPRKVVVNERLTGSGAVDPLLASIDPKPSDEIIEADYEPTTEPATAPEEGQKS